MGIEPSFSIFLKDLKRRKTRHLWDVGKAATLHQSRPKLQCWLWWRCLIVDLWKIPVLGNDRSWNRLNCYSKVFLNKKRYTVQVCKICWDIHQYLTMFYNEHSCLSLVYWSTGCKVLRSPMSRQTSTESAARGQVHQRSPAEKDQQMHNMLGIPTVTTVFTHIYAGIEPGFTSLCEQVVNIFACILMIFFYSRFNDCLVSLSEQPRWNTGHFIGFLPMSFGVCTWFGEIDYPWLSNID